MNRKHTYVLITAFNFSSAGKDSLSLSPAPLRMSTEMVSTEPVPPLELSEDILDKFDPHCSLSGKCSFGNACPISQERVLGHPAFRQVREKGPPET